MGGLLELSVTRGRGVTMGRPSGSINRRTSRVISDPGAGCNQEAPSGSIN